jgi:hypothetical protein
MKIIDFFIQNRKAYFKSFLLMAAIVAATEISDLLPQNDCGCDNNATKTQVVKSGFCFNLIIWNSCNAPGKRWFWQ